MFYSMSTCGFYDIKIHGENIPTDAVEITTEEYRNLLNGQSNGRPIKADSQGRPYNEEPQAITLDMAKATKLEELAALRYEKETSGVTFGGATILTDGGSQAKLTGAWVRVQRFPETRINWKGASGWSEIGKAEVEAVCDVVSRHVQHCFDNERIHSENIMALVTIEEVDVYDINVGW